MANANPSLTKSKSGPVAFEVNLQFRDEEGDLHPIPGGPWRGMAIDARAAKTLAMESLWDKRLESASCSPVAEVKKIKRYACSDSWEHIFAGNRTETTRWAVDRSSGKLVAAQVLNEASWVTVDQAAVAKLQESLDYYDVSSDGFDMESNSLPGWCHIEASKNAT